MDGEVKLPIAMIFLLLVIVEINSSRDFKSQLDLYQRIRKITKIGQKMKPSPKCPTKCICFVDKEVSVVRCMFLRWRKIPKIHENTNRL